MQITTMLTGAQPRTVNRRDGSGSFTLFELFDHEGTAWVAKKDVFDGAIPFVGSGQPVDMIVRVEQNGQWTNRYVDIITPSGGIVPQTNVPSVAMQAAARAQEASGARPTAQPTITGGPYAGPLTGAPALTEKDRQIHRQVAAKVAGGISANADEFWQNAVDLARYFDTGRIPGDSDPHAGEPQFAAANEYAHADADIPF